MILTLLAIGAIVGAYLYIAVLGSRAAETTRARTAADATAMAAATVKARTLNYEAFILLADTVLLPLGQLSHNIVQAQNTWNTTVCVPCMAACPYCPLCQDCIRYQTQIARTAAQQPMVDRTVSNWLDGLEAMAEALDSVGPYWAEETAQLIGMNRPSYGGPGSHGVSFVASFPLPDQKCGRLGIDMIGNMEQVQGRAACTDLKELELAYHAMQMDPIFIGFNLGGQAMNGKLLTQGSPCSKTNKVPKLADDWDKYRFSRGMALEMNPNDDWQLSYQESLRQHKPPKALETGFLLGMGCAEHYSQDHQDKESLWHMDWRARLIPCEYEKREAQDQVLQCGGVSAPGAPIIQAQFRRQLMLRVEKDWKW